MTKPRLGRAPTEDELRSLDKKRAVRRAGKLGDTAFLLACLEDESRIRTAAAKWLGKLHAKEAVPRLVELVESEHWQARVDATRALARIGDPSAIPTLARAARTDTVAPARSSALYALAMVEGAGAEPDLLAALDDQDWRVRVAAVTGLGMVGTADALEPLRQARRREPWRLALLHLLRWLPPRPAQNFDARVSSSLYVAAAWRIRMRGRHGLALREAVAATMVSAGAALLIPPAGAASSSSDRLSPTSLAIWCAVWLVLLARSATGNARRSGLLVGIPYGALLLSIPTALLGNLDYLAAFWATWFLVHGLLLAAGVTGGGRHPSLWAWSRPTTTTAPIPSAE